MATNTDQNEIRVGIIGVGRGMSFAHGAPFVGMELVALFVGPGDLGLRLSQRESSNQTTLNEAIAQVATAAKKHNIAWGIPAGTPELIKQYREMGAQLLAYGGDFALTAVLERSSQDFDEALGE